MLQQTTDYRAMRRDEYASEQLADRIESAADRIRRSLIPLDVIGDAASADECGDMMAALHAGDYEAASREWARLVSAYCVRCAERAEGVL